MPQTLLRTKLNVPPIRPNIVPRPHLIKHLNQGLQQGHKLTLISAPAGFGKTTLVSYWMNSLQLDNFTEGRGVNRVAWLSLDENDNDLTRFLSYFIAALREVEGLEGSFGNGALSMLKSPQEPLPEDVLTSLINEVAASSGRITLVLDDYHLVDATPIDKALTFLLEHLPLQLHLVLATRVDPQLPLARLRARGQLTELRAADLRFTSAESVEFLNRAMGLNLSAEDVAALEMRTEGWITGLQLAAVSMRGNRDASGFIKSFTGSHRFVLDYLIEEVMDQQPEGVQTFMLQTAILGRLTGSLCDALTGQNNGQTILETLENANLFIIPLDEERRWYRYHHLFSDLLRRRLRQTHPDWIPTLHIQASEWYQQNGLTDQAIEHALYAKDYGRAANVIEEQADVVWQHGEPAKLRRWLAKLPEEIVFTKPPLCIFHGWFMFVSGQQDAAEKSLQVVEDMLDANDAHDIKTRSQQRDAIIESGRAQLQGRAAAVRAFMDSYRGDVHGIIEHARLALEYLPEEDSTWRSNVAMVLGDAHGFKGDMAAAYEARLEAMNVYNAAGESYFAMLAGMKVAITLRSQGLLQRTIEICPQQVRTADESGLSHTSLTGLLLLIWGEVLVELNDLDGAQQKATKGLTLLEQGVDLAMVGWGYMCLARIMFSRGDLTGIEGIVLKLERIARESNVPSWVMNQMLGWRTRAWLAQDNLDAAAQWVKENGLDGNKAIESLHEIDFFLLFDYILLARVLIAQGQLDDATGLLQQLIEPAETGGRTTRLIEILLLQALAFQAKGQIDRALFPLKQALTLAEPEGFIRIFADEGQLMARLLHEALNRGISSNYVRRLLAALSTDEPATAETMPFAADQSELVEPLSDREIEVLQLIADGHTNREIGERLYLSINTVKVHTRNIYGKLDVHTRIEAVARARELGVLPSS